MNLSEIDISIYNGVKDTGKEAENRKVKLVSDILESIQNGTYKALITKLRAVKEEKRYKQLKENLPAVTWSGIFNERKKSDIVSHSGIICFDLDKLTPEEIETISLQLSSDPYVFAYFISPSGAGLKFLVSIPVEDVPVKNLPQYHENYFRAFRNYFTDQYKFKLDESGKDCSRLCFLSFDSKLYRDDNKAVFGQEQFNTWADKQKEKAAPKSAPAIGFNTTFQDIRTFTDKIKSYEPGKRNDYINMFVGNCKGKGISEDETLSYCLTEFTDYQDGPKALKNIVTSVYANSKIEFGKYSKTCLPAQRASVPSASPTGKKSTGYNESIVFWYLSQKVNQKTGEVTEEMKFDHDKFTFFLNNNGFKKIEVGDNFQFIRITDNKIEPVDDDKITHFIDVYLAQNLQCDASGNYTDVQDELYEVRKMFKRGKKTYANEKAYASLPVFKPNFIRDTEHKAFMYFRNCYVEITKDSIETKEYKELDGHIWSKQIIQRDFHKLPNDEIDQCIFSLFLELAICGKLEKPDEKAKQKYVSALTGIGYMLHRFKDPANAKAVVTVDRKLRQANDSNGRTGKSLYFKAIGKVLHACILNGKKFKFDMPYPFETLNLDHGALVFNDVKKNFDFEELFHYITEDFDYSKKYVDAIIIPYEESPKLGVATNFSLKGNSDSFLARQHVIEFTDYFNATHQPIHEFGGKRFFHDWDDAEYNRFFNFMLFCEQLFLKKGLVPFPLENYGINKLMDAAGEEFVEWMDEKFGISPNSERVFDFDIKYERNLIFESFKKDFPNIKKYALMGSTHSFTGWVTEWAKERGLQKHESKSGATYSWMFSIIPDKK